MAAPKVFVSSTCFDLGEVREQLKQFIRSYGFEPVLSENGDVFYHPDLHTHESCVHEVSNCQLFVLIIGGRFGGKYVSDKAKSITNAEYVAAREKNIPVFTYVRDVVLHSHNIFNQNKKKEFVADIDYPGIEKQEHAMDIFKFIDDVRRSPSNNAFERFNGFHDIELHLRKQWAGLFYDLLKSREVKAQIDITNHLVSNLSASSQKLEELVKSLYIASSGDAAEREIELIEVFSGVETFYEYSLRPSWLNENEYLLDVAKINVEEISEVSPVGLSCDKYLIATGLFKPTMVPVFDEDDGILTGEYEDGFECVVTRELNTKFILDGDFYQKAAKYYEGSVVRSTKDQRKKALARVVERYSI
jgi:hypothetical protein